MAIKAKELMIGNLLLSGSEVVKVWSMENPLQYTVVDKDFSTFGGNYFEPITLTEDWLIRLGFEKQYWVIDNKIQTINGGDNGFDGSIVYSIEKCDVFFYNGEFYYLIDSNSDDYGYNYTVRKIQYIHQFQNLHFALTGEELNLKN